MIDFDALAAAMGELDEDTVKELLEAVMKEGGADASKALLAANGFDVLNLGIDCPAEKIASTVKAENIRIVALSGILTLALDSMKAAVEALRQECPGVKVIISGAPVSADVCKNIGADEWAHSPQKTVTTSKSWASA